MYGNNTKTRSFVMGGIEKGESPSEASIREVREETGYNDINVEFVSNYKVVRHFYADYKGVNRYAYLNIIFATLNTQMFQTLLMLRIINLHLKCIYMVKSLYRNGRIG